MEDVRFFPEHHLVMEMMERIVVDVPRVSGVGAVFIRTCLG